MPPRGDLKTAIDNFKQPGSASWKAQRWLANMLIRVRTRQPDTYEVLKVNPLGIFIDNLEIREAKDLR